MNGDLLNRMNLNKSGGLFSIRRLPFPSDWLPMKLKICRTGRKSVQFLALGPLVTAAASSEARAGLHTPLDRKCRSQTLKFFCGLTCFQLVAD
jgi:hypothetical protein